MTAQAAIVAMGRVAPQLTSALTQEQCDEFMRLWRDVHEPVSEDDVRALIAMLPADGDTAFGFNWTVLHAIERSLCWPLWELMGEDNEWQRS